MTVVLAVVAAVVVLGAGLVTWTLCCAAAIGDATEIVDDEDDPEIVALRETEQPTREVA